MDYDITSPQNERIKRLVRLKERAHRDSEGLFVVEGRRLISRALTAGLEPVELYVNGATDLNAPMSPLIVKPAVLDKASYRKRSEGLIAVFETFSTNLEDVPLQKTPLLVATESVEKPGNVGAILRTADGAGADAVIGVGATIDPFNPNLLRASTGAVFTTPLATASFEELLAFCRSRSIALMVADPGAETTHFETDLTGPTCLLVGAEDAGVSNEALAGADTVFSVPMAGKVDSLNVSSTVAIALYEAIRQRSTG